MNLENIKKQFPAWNKKTAVTIGNSRQYKIIGMGKSAFKVIKFEPQQELGNKGGWSQVFWNFNDIKKDTEAFKVIEKMESMMGGQTTL
jgi:hypothetical protein